MIFIYEGVIEGLSHPNRNQSVQGTHILALVKIYPAVRDCLQDIEGASNGWKYRVRSWRS